MAKWDALRKTKRDKDIYGYWKKHHNDMTLPQIAEHFTPKYGPMARSTVNRIILLQRALDPDFCT